MFRVSAKTTRWDDASETARRIEQQINAADPVIPTDSTPIEDAVSAYLADKRAQQLSPDTLKKLELYFEKQLLGWCAANGVHSLADLNLLRLREWRATWKDGPLSSKKKQERVIGFFHFCQSSGWVKDNPARQLSRIKVTQKPTDYFTEEEIDRIIAATYKVSSGDKLRVLILLMRWSGLAIRDAVTLERSRLNDYDQIFLYRAKTGVPVQLTLPPIVAATLRKHKNSNPRYFFWSGNGNRKSVVADWQRAFRRLFKEVGLQHEDGTAKRAYPHMFRNSFAVECLLAGVPLHDVAILLGHSSVKTTERHYSPFVMARQVQLTDLVKQTWSAKNNETNDEIEEI